ncbi:MAG: class I SAM-dependent methyltransferase [Polyangiaceae bacterium]|nr:class I SAM-dependent methyltransferase [Polyangiaceae bacterium]
MSGVSLHDRVLRASSALARETGLEAPETGLLGRLPRLLERVSEWTKRVDLTAARDPDTLVDLYLADAWVLAAAGSEGSWVDVGAGGGAPGLALAMLRPTLELTLVESRAKRVAFLRTSGADLGLENVRVLRSRSEQLLARSFDVAVSRAALPPVQWLAEGTRLARRSVWVLLAGQAAPTRSGARICRELTYTWPLTRTPRRAVCYAIDG